MEMSAAFYPDLAKSIQNYKVLQSDPFAVRMGWELAQVVISKLGKSCLLKMLPLQTSEMGWICQAFLAILKGILKA